MKIAVFGTGGVGGIFGGLFSKHGHEVHFVARGKHLAQMAAQGLKVNSAQGDFLIHPVHVTDDPKKVGPVDLVLVCVKSWQMDEACKALPPLVGPGTLILPLLNGLEATEILLAKFPHDQMLRGFCAVISYVDAPGVIKQIGALPYLAFGEMDNRSSDRVQALKKELSVPGINLETPVDILAAQWQKYLFICSLGVISALSRIPSGELKTIPTSRALIISAMKEVEAVARAAGVNLLPNAVENAVKQMDQGPPTGTTSMQRDVLAGRRSELEAFSGYLHRLGQKLNVSTPVHETCYHLLLPLELKAQKTLSESIAAGPH